LGDTWWHSSSPPPKLAPRKPSAGGRATPTASDAQFRPPTTHTLYNPLLPRIIATESSLPHPSAAHNFFLLLLYRMETPDHPRNPT